MRLVESCFLQTFTGDSDRDWYRLILEATWILEELGSFEAVDISSWFVNGPLLYKSEYGIENEKLEESNCADLRKTDSRQYLLKSAAGKSAIGGRNEHSPRPASPKSWMHLRYC